MKKEIPFERRNPLVFRMPGVRAHKIEGEVESRAKFLVDEAREWGGGSGDRMADITKMEEDIRKAVLLHHAAHTRMIEAMRSFSDAERAAKVAATNPLLSEEIVEARLAKLKEKVRQAFREVVETNRDLEPFRFNADHQLVGYQN